MLYIITYIFFDCQDIIIKKTNFFRSEENSMKEPLIIKKKELRGEDGYKTFSIRIKEETVAELDRLSAESNRSRNELVNILLQYALKHCEIQ